MESVVPILLGVVGVAFALVGIWWHFSRSNDLLQKWAEENGYRILDQQYCYFFKGPFFWTSSNGQTVYYVAVEDREGQRRHGWVCCGGWFLGLLSDKAEVRWDD